MSFTYGRSPYNEMMRLLVAIFWSVATLLWVPWFAVLVRFLIDVAMGVPPSSSDYLNPALVWVWPTHGWLAWEVISWWPMLGVLAMALTYIGWRFFWWADDWKPSYNTLTVIATIIVPPTSLVLLYVDMRRRFRQRNSKLRAEAHESLQHLDERDALGLLSRR